MNSCRTVVTIFLCSTLLCCFSATLAAEMKPSAGVNLASGKTSTFTIAPSYGYCSDKGDPTDLTDGEYWQPGDDKGFWTQSGTVGWASLNQPAGIKMDLGEISPIRALTLDSAAGAAQVTFPAAALLYVSDDGKNWHFVTDIINEAVQQHTFSRHRFVTDDLNTRGRYIFIYLVRGGFHTFTDEIEVLKGDHDPAAVRFASPAVPKQEILSAVKARAKLSKQKNTSLYLIKAATDALEKLDEPRRNDAMADIEKIVRQVVHRNRTD